MKFCEIWHLFSRARIRNFLWCQFCRWVITSLALEKCKKECNTLQIILVQGFCSDWKLKLLNFLLSSVGFRPNLLEWKYDGTEPFHSNCSPGERLKRLTRLRRTIRPMQYNYPATPSKASSLNRTGMTLQQLSVISRSSLDKCENCQWVMCSASRINTLRQHCCSVPRCFWIYQT